MGRRPVGRPPISPRTIASAFQQLVLKTPPMPVQAPVQAGALSVHTNPTTAPTGSGLRARACMLRFLDGMPEAVTPGARLIGVF